MWQFSQLWILRGAAWETRPAAVDIVLHHVGAKVRDSLRHKIQPPVCPEAPCVVFTAKS